MVYRISAPTPDEKDEWIHSITYVEGDGGNRGVIAVVLLSWIHNMLEYSVVRMDGDLGGSIHMTGRVLVIAEPVSC